MIHLKGKITQEGESAPVVTIFNDELIDFGVTEYLQVGEYKAVCNRAILNNNMPPKWFNADSQGSRYALSQVNQTDVIIQCFDRKGNPKDGFLSGNEFEVETK